MKLFALLMVLVNAVLILVLVSALPQPLDHPAMVCVPASNSGVPVLFCYPVEPANEGAQ